MSGRILRFLHSFLAIAMLWLPASAPARSIGSEPYSVAGGEIFVSGQKVSLRVPAQYHVVSIEKAPRRLLITAYAIIDSASEQQGYLSEVWLFPINAAVADTLSFDARRVVISLESPVGQKTPAALYTVSCGSASAVYVHEYEGGRTLLFDKTGMPLSVAWPRNKPGEGCCLDFILPLAWIVEPSGERLVCRANFLGDDSPLLLIYDANTGTFEYRPMTQALGELGSLVVNSILASRGVY